MSGGLYGRGKAPARACLQLPCWPEADQRLWNAACAPLDLLSFEEGGDRSRHAAASNAKAIKGYGRWLTFLTMREPDVLALGLGEGEEVALALAVPLTLGLGD